MAKPEDAETVVVINELKWPKDPIERIERLRSLVKEKAGLTSDAIQQHFTSGGSKKARDAAIIELLGAMAAAGMIVEVDGGRWF